MTQFKKPKPLLSEEQSVPLTDRKEKINAVQNETSSARHLTLEEYEVHLSFIFNKSSDLNFKYISFDHWNRKILFVNLETSADVKLVQDEVINPLFELGETVTPESLHTVIQAETTLEEDINKSSELLLDGKTLIFIEGYDVYYAAATAAGYKRDITEPSNERVIRGSHDGFIEDLTTNIAIIRKRIKNPKLVVKYFTAGKETQSKGAILYVDGIANKEIVKKVENRISCIDSDSVLTPGNIIESIEDHPFSPFPQILDTERPDRAAGNLMEGRVVVLTAQSPMASIMPANFFSFYQSSDDYNTRWMLGSFFRFIRIFSFFTALGFPALYIAVVSFHFEVIPSGLVLAIKSSLENIPYPPLIEAMIMELTIELIREASIRLPSPIGQTIAIVGGLVIGDAVVSAGLVSNMMIIVVAITAISAYIVPSNEMSEAVRIIRFPLMVLAGTLGFIGIVIGFMLLFMHLTKLTSFGVPFFSPLAPLRTQNMRDALIRLPFWKLNQRPLDAKPQKLKQENRSRRWEEQENNE
ncbi:spore germination protein [Fictibacillus iocasae]|uniref:Spore germination protein n=1 Tax=Fictibacillus iocasae TaxID=2715437 RepID=A0ABW2NSW3_9BACL